MPERIENSERVRVPGGVRAARVAERKTFDGSDGSDGRTFGEDYESPPLSDAQQAEVDQTSEETKSSSDGKDETAK